MVRFAWIHAEFLVAVTASSTKNPAKNVTMAMTSTTTIVQIAARVPNAAIRLSRPGWARSVTMAKTTAVTMVADWDALSCRLSVAMDWSKNCTNNATTVTIRARMEPALRIVRLLRVAATASYSPSSKLATMATITENLENAASPVKSRLISCFWWRLAPPLAIGLRPIRSPNAAIPCGNTQRFFCNGSALSLILYVIYAFARI